MQHNQHIRYRADIVKWRIGVLRMSLREVSGLTESTSPETVRNIVNGKNTSIDSLSAVAKTLSLDIKTLFDFKLKERDFHRALNGVKG